MQKISFLFILTIMLVVGIVVLVNNMGNKNDSKTLVSEYKKIKPSEAKAKLEQDKKIVLLDVRTQSEYQQGHIPGSILLPVNELVKKIESVVADKNREIIVYCRSGNRSKTASKKLIKMGYKKVYDLGGIIDWPYEIE